MPSHPEWIDRRNARRTVPMQVLDFGFSRTGTSSMQQALEILGYKQTNHGHHVFGGGPHDIDMWLAAINAKFSGIGKPYERKDWDRLLGHCQAVTDTPHYLFVKELMEAYPDAKVILTTRDPDSWWKSISETAGVWYTSPLRRIDAWLNPEHAGRLYTLMRVSAQATFGTETWFQEPDRCKARFIAHYEEVRKMTPKDKLLQFSVKDGWEPLCKFLGKDIPEVPFPRVFETRAFKEQLKEADRRILKQLFVKILTPMAVVMLSTALAVYLRGLRK